MELISLVTHLLSFRALALSMRACKQIQSCALTQKLLFLMHLRFLIETVYFGTANCYCSQVPINLIILSDSIYTLFPSYPDHLPTVEILMQSLCYTSQCIH